MTRSPSSIESADAAFETQCPKTQPRSPWSILLLAVVSVACMAAAATAADEPIVHRSQLTGNARFLIPAPAAPVQAQQMQIAPVPLDAIVFVNRYADEFGISDAATQLRQIEQHIDAIGHTHTSFQQQHEGIDVFSGILRVHRDPAGSLVAINGDFYPVSPKIATSPTIAQQDAVDACLRALKIDTAETESAELVIVDPGWYGDASIGAHLAYHIVIASPAAGIREAFFIDADNGEVLDQWTMLHSARVREIYDGQGGTGLPGLLTRGENDPIVGSPEDVNRAYDYYADVYAYFFNAFGRDSIDGNGMTMVATVNSNFPPCPNAQWNGQQMIFCDGTVTDDIVAHELTHGVTQFTADLIYQNQSGQLNESFSDVFGELVDLYNGGAEFAGEPTPTPFGNHPTGPGEDSLNDLRGDDCSPSPALEITSPMNIAGRYVAGIGDFGDPLTPTGVSGTIVEALPALGCDSDVPFSNSAELNGAIALLDVGTCSFTEKVLNAQDAGAVAAILINNVPDAPPTFMSGFDLAIFIPSIMISNEDGALIRAELVNGSVDGTLRTLGYAKGVRWLMGEDAALFGGAIRDMWNPPCHNDPDFANSALQTCNVLDSGGVHSGSGIPNHAFAILTDGKTFNGYTINGIGPIKAGAVWYRALSEYLTPASDFAASYSAFLQAADDLIGTDPNDPRTGLPSGNVFTAADADEVEKALLAVEMHTEGACGASDDVLNGQDPGRCADREMIFFDDFETGAAGWTVFNSNPPTPYDWVLTTGNLPQGRGGIAWFCDDANVGDCQGQNESGTHSLTSPAITIPPTSNHPRLSFMHLIGTEGGWDGGNLKINVNGTGWQVIPRQDYAFNAVNAPLNTINQTSTNPLAGEPGWTGAGGPWGLSIVDLAALAGPGDSLQFRFEFGKDGCTGGEGWYVDDFEVYNCIDCDADMAADIEQLRFTYSTSTQGNIGAGSPQTFVIPSPPMAASDVVLRGTARGDFSSILEYLNVDINGTDIGDIFVNNATDCAGTPDVETIVIPMADFNAAVNGADATITFIATGEVNGSLNNGACRGESFLAFSIEYELDAADCDNNLGLDDCQAGGITIAGFVAELLAPSSGSCFYDFNQDGNIDGLDVQTYVTQNVAP